MINICYIYYGLVKSTIISPRVLADTGRGASDFNMVHI